MHDPGTDLNRMAASATLHCLTGCAIGEIMGMLIGTAAGFSPGLTIALSVALAFVFGFALSTLPLLNAGLGLAAALGVVVAADTLSIATMEIVDNAVMALIPGAMDAGLVNPVFWLGMALSLLIAYAVAFPVNRSLLARGKGHALTHVHHVAADSSARRWPVPGSTALAVAIGTFMLGGFVVSVADALEDPGTDRTAPGLGPPEAVAVPTVGGPQPGETPDSAGCGDDIATVSCWPTRVGA